MCCIGVVYLNMARLPLAASHGKGYADAMSTVEDIEKAVRHLPPGELANFRAWFAEFDASLWDRQIEEDAAKGSLDALADEAARDIRDGRVKDL